MAINLYDTPAQAPMVSQFVPIPFDDIFRVATALNAQNQASADKLDRFYQDYSKFRSPSEIDTADYYNTAMGNASSVAEYLSKNPDAIKTPEGKSMINNAIRNVDYAHLANLEQSKSQMLYAMELEGKLAAAGKWNKDWHQKNYGAYDTSKQGVFQDINLTPYESIAEGTAPYFSNMKDSYLKTVGGFDYYGVDQNALRNVVQQQLNAYAITPEGQLHMQTFKKNNPGATDAQALQWLGDEMYQANYKNYRVTREINPYTKMEIAAALKPATDKKPSGSGSGFDGTPLTYEQSRMNIDQQRIKLQLDAMLSSQKDQPLSVPKQAFSEILPQLMDKSTIDTINKDPELQQAYKQFTDFIQNNTVSDLTQDKKTTLGKTFEAIDSAVSSGIISQGIGDNLKSKFGYGAAQAMSQNMQSQIYQAAISGDENVLKALQNTKGTITQDVVHQLLGGMHDYKRIWTDNSDGEISPSSRMSNMIETHVRPQSLYTTRNGIPLSEISKSYSQGKINYDPNKTEFTTAIPLGFSAPIKTTQRKAITDNAMSNLPGLLDYIRDNTGRNLKWSSLDETFRYTGKDDRSREYANGIQYIPRKELKKVIQNYIDSTGLKGLSADNYIDIIVKGKLGEQRRMGTEIGNMRTGYGKGGDIKETGSMKDVIGLYLAMPMDELNVDPMAQRKIESEWAEKYGQSNRDAVLQQQDALSTFSPEERQQFMLEEMLQNNQNYRTPWQ